MKLVSTSCARASASTSLPRNGKHGLGEDLTWDTRLHLYASGRDLRGDSRLQDGSHNYGRQALREDFPLRLVTRDTDAVLPHIMTRTCTREIMTSAGINTASCTMVVKTMVTTTCARTSTRACAIIPA